MTTTPIPDLTVIDSTNTWDVNDKFLAIAQRVRNLTNVGLLPFAYITPPSDVANKVYATPDSATAAKGNAALRLLTANDLPAIPDAKLTANVALLNRASQVFTGDPQTVNGKLGVGVAAPLEKFEVAGAVRVTGVTGNVTANTASFDYSAIAPAARIVSFGSNASTCAGFQILLRSSDASIQRTPIAVDSNNNIGLGSAGSFGGGAGVIFILSSVTAPTSNPTGGFLLYVDPADGKVKLRGPSGTITVLANP
jgi:hypothetical protein